MGFDAYGLKVMVAAPSDMEEAKHTAKAAINDWSGQHAEHYGACLIPVSWDSHAVPDYGDRAQSFINRQLVDKSDALIALFGMKLGTDTGEAVSGTVEEMERLSDAGKRVLVYFSTSRVSLPQVDPHELMRLRSYQERLKKQALYFEFASLPQLRELLQRHLTDWVRERPDNAVPRRVLTAESPNRDAPDCEEAEAIRRAFDERIRGGSFNGMKKGVPTLGVSIIPDMPTAATLDLAEVRKKYIYQLHGMQSNSQELETFAGRLVRHDGRNIGSENQQTPSSAVELTANGSIFAALDLMEGTSPEFKNNNYLQFEYEERELVSSVATYVRFLRNIGVPGPLWVGVTLFSVQGQKLILDSRSRTRTRVRPLPEGEYVVAAVMLGEAVDGLSVAPVAGALQSGLLNIWNDGNVSSDPCFHDGQFLISQRS